MLLPLPWAPLLPLAPLCCAQHPAPKRDECRDRETLGEFFPPFSSSPAFALSSLAVPSPWLFVASFPSSLNPYLSFLCLCAYSPSPSSLSLCSGWYLPISPHFPSYTHHSHHPIPFPSPLHAITILSHPTSFLSLSHSQPHSNSFPPHPYPIPSHSDHHPVLSHPILSVSHSHHHPILISIMSHPIPISIPLPRHPISPHPH